MRQGAPVGTACTGGAEPIVGAAAGIASPGGAATGAAAPTLAGAVDAVTGAVGVGTGAAAPGSGSHLRGIHVAIPAHPGLALLWTLLVAVVVVWRLPVHAVPTGAP